MFGWNDLCSPWVDFGGFVCCYSRGGRVQGGPKQWLSMELSGEMMMTGMNVEAYRSYIRRLICKKSFFWNSLQYIVDHFMCLSQVPFCIRRRSMYEFHEHMMLRILHSIWNLGAEIFGWKFLGYWETWRNGPSHRNPQLNPETTANWLFFSSFGAYRWTSPYWTLDLDIYINSSIHP